jgi:hypothetical protein
MSFVLMLEQDPVETFASGRISLGAGDGMYQIRGSRALFELLYAWLNPELTDRNDA